MLNLLKEKSKIAYKPKSRRRYKPYIPQIQSSQMISIPQSQPQVAQPPLVPKKITPTVLQNYDAGKDRDMK
jgi:hypothetical protein